MADAGGVHSALRGEGGDAGGLWGRGRVSGECGVSGWCKGRGRGGHTAHAGMSAKWPWAAVEVA